MKTIHFAAALATAAWAVGAAGTAASASDEGKTHTERVIIMTDAKGHDGESVRHDPDGARVRAFTLTQDGASCSGTRDVVDEQSADGKEKTHIIFCSNGEGNSAERAARLEKALARIEQNQELSAEHKAKVVAALRDAISRLQATP
jgi:hypothetical protein